MNITHTIPDALTDAVSKQFESRTARDLGDPGDPTATPPVPPRAPETTAAHVTRAVAEWLDGEIMSARKGAAAAAVKAATDDTALGAALVDQHHLAHPAR